MKTSVEVVVVGGGVIGSAIALELAKRGIEVLLLEKGCIAGQASSAAAGMMGVHAEIEDEGVFYSFARKSRDRFPDLAEELRERSGIDIQFQSKGMYKIALTEQQAEEWKKKVLSHRYRGEEINWVDREELQKREPFLSQNALGAIELPKDGHVSARHFTLALAKSAESCGAKIKEFSEVVDWIWQDGKIRGVQTLTETIYFDQVVIAAGVWTKRLAEQLELSLSMIPVKGECFSVVTPAPLLSRTVFSEKCYLVPKSGGRLVVGATMTENTMDRSVELGSIFGLMQEAQRILPGIRSAKWEKAWAGIRPQTADGLPYIGAHPEWDHVWIAAGHYRNGILLAPITGELITDLIEGKPVDPAFSQAFRIDRPAGEGVGQMKRVQINGEQMEIPDQIQTIADLIRHFQLDHKLVIVERNSDILEKPDCATTPVCDGDKIEMVHFVGGG